MESANPESRDFRIGEMSILLDELNQILPSIWLYKDIELMSDGASVLFGEAPFGGEGLVENLVQADEKIQNIREHVIYLKGQDNESSKHRHLIQYWESNLDIMYQAVQDTFQLHQDILTYHKNQIAKVNNWLQRCRDNGIDIQLPKEKFKITDLFSILNSRFRSELE